MHRISHYFSLSHMASVALAVLCGTASADYSQVKISNPDEGVFVALLGYTLAFDGQTLLSAGQQAGGGSGSGIAFAYRRNGEGEWIEEAKVVCPETPPDVDYFGQSLAVWGDEFFVGSPGASTDGRRDGAVYVFRRSGQTWVQSEKLIASDRTEGDDFGWSVASDGNTVVIGAREDDDLGIRSGSAYIFTRTDEGWAEVQKLTAPDGQAEHYFGYAVAVAGDMVAVSATFDDDGGTNSGSVYVFRRGTGGSWAYETELIPSLSNPGDQYGYSLAASGNSILIGGVGITANFPRGNSAYVFTHQKSVWVEEARLVASDSATLTGFGEGVAISGDTAVIGSYGPNNFTGSAYVFARTEGVWSEQKKLLPDNDLPNIHFGRAVAVGGDTIFASAQRERVGGSGGTAYGFEQVGTDWNLEHKLSHEEAAFGDGFGRNVAVSGDTLVTDRSGTTSFYRNVLGAWRLEQDIEFTGSSLAIEGETTFIGDSGFAEPGSLAGAVRVYERGGEGWSLSQQLSPSDPLPFRKFGTSVAVDGDTLVVGAPDDADVTPPDPNANPGAAYVFVRSGGAWVEQAKLVPDDGNIGDAFGLSVDVSGDYIIVGAPEYEEEANPPVFFNRGAVYFFKRTGGTWQQQQMVIEGSPSSQYATSVAISGSTAIVGSLTIPSDIYSLTGNTWSLQQSIPAPADNDDFGRTVAIDGDRLAIGSYQANGTTATRPGAAAIFRRDGVQWTREGIFRPSDATDTQRYGSSISLSGATLVIGSPDHDDPERNSGAVYVIQEYGVGDAWMLQ